MYQTTLTSQGTLTLPAAIRRRYNLRSGDSLTIEDDGEIHIIKTIGFGDMRKKNQTFAKVVRAYKQGDGMAAHVIQKYGKK